MFTLEHFLLSSIKSECFYYVSPSVSLTGEDIKRLVEELVNYKHFSWRR